MARYLARCCQARLVLLARSPLPPRGAWEGWLAAHAADDEVSQRIGRVQAIEALGAEVLVIAADVADAAAVAGAVAAAEERFGALHGVVHAAGHVAPGAFTAIGETSARQLARHLAPKVRGAVALARALDGRRLDFCLLTSSLSSVLGGLGHGAYSAANRVLDAFAVQQSRAGRVPWLSVNWDSWRYDAATEARTLRGATVAELNMSEEEGLETFERCLLLDGERQVVVSTGDLGRRLAQWVQAAPAAAGAVAPAAARHPRPALDTPYAPPRDDTEAGVAAIWQEVLGLDQVGRHDSFFDLGGHSLVATRLFFRLRERFATDLPLKALFEAPTVAAMAALVVSGGDPAAGAAVDWQAECDLGPFTVAPPPAAAAPVPPAAAPAPVAPASAAPAPAASRARPSGSTGRVLLTGATGFLGAFLLDQLLRSTAADVVCLVREGDAGGRAAAADSGGGAAGDGRERLRRNLARFGLEAGETFDRRVAVVAGDLGRPALGLDAAHFAALAASLEAVFHAGALVNFLSPYSQARAANVAGTREILRLAAAHHAKPLHYISTIGVISPPSRRRAAPLGEDEDYGEPAALQLGYTQSKWVAERLVAAAGRAGLPVAIYRPGAISGHSVTGACQESDFYWLLVRACIEMGAVPAIDLPLPLTPVDFVVRAIVQLARRPATGRVYHLVPPRPLPLGELAVWLRSFGYRLATLPYERWREGLAARLARDAASADTAASADHAANALLALFPAGASDREIEAGLGGAPFAAANTAAGLAGTAIACPPLAGDLLGTYVSYFVRRGFLPPPVEAAGERRQRRGAG
jgi:thioester reductase-like protein